MTIILTGQERAVLKLIIQGYQNKKISTILNISIRTVEFHCSNIYTKLGVEGRVQAVIRAIETRICEE